MSYKDKPQIKLYKYENNSFVMQAQIDDFQEVSFEHNIYESGTFTITINYNIPNALLFQRGLFCQFGNNPYDFGEIITIQDAIGQDGKGSQIRTITGRDARYILKRRVIKNMNSNGLWAMTDKGEIVLRNLIKDQCGIGAETKRQLPIANTIPASADAKGKVYSVSENFTNLYEVCKTIATQSEIGWRMSFDGSGLSLEVFEGADLSQTVRFDTSYESLANGEFQDSSDAYSNAIYIGGKGQNDDRDIYEGEDGTPEGLDRFESWDNQSSLTVESEYEAEALSMLTQYGQTITMRGNGLAKCPYIFREQYDIGDFITVAFSGKSAKAQILSITEHWVFAEYDLEFSFGKPQPTQSDQLQLMLRKIQEASNKTNSTDSVRWYTIPTDTAMPKADVTYNTIGFVGTVGTGATFTLYLDNEKTGAKTYHVYFKQLGGTGKLTLTTGKAGASNLTLNAGTYVAIIYVDENGNVTNTASTPTSTIEAGNTQPATSGGVASAISQITETNIIYDNTITDCNNAFQVGKSVTYCLDGSVSNVPSSSYGWYVISQCNPATWSGNKYVSQIATVSTNNNVNLIYTRHAYLNNGAMAWTAWEKLENLSDITTRFRGMRFCFLQGSSSSAYIYYKISGIAKTYAVGENAVFLLTSRAGETILITAGSNDASFVPPIINRLNNVYTKITGFSYDSNYLYVKVNAWANMLSVTQIAGNNVSNITIETATQAQYEAGTSIPIKTSVTLETGSQTKVYSNSASLANASLGNNGYFTLSIPSDIDNSRIISIVLWCASIAASNGFQMTPFYAGNSTLYVNYYKPASWQQDSITLYYKIIYTV